MQIQKEAAGIKKQLSYKICRKHHVIIRYMEINKNHIHYMIETEPTMSISKIVNLVKSYTTYHIWERYPDYLRKHFLPYKQNIHLSKKYVPSRNVFAGSLDIFPKYDT